RLPIDARQVLDWGGRRHLLEPEQLERLEPPGEVEPALHVEMAVDIDEQVRFRPDRLSDGGGAGDPELRELLDAGPVAQVARHLIEGRELYGVEAGLHSLLRRGRETLRRARLGGAVDIGVIADPGLDAASEELIGWDRVHFAADVPQALLKCARGHCGGRAAAGDLRLDRATEPFDIVDAPALQ